MYESSYSTSKEKSLVLIQKQKKDILNEIDFMKNKHDNLVRYCEDLTENRNEIISDINNFKLKRKDLEDEIDKLNYRRDNLQEEVTNVLNSLNIVRDKKIYEYESLTKLVIEFVIDVFDTTREELLSKRRYRNLVEARGCVNIMLKKHKDLGYSAIAKIYREESGEKMDHATIINSLSKSHILYEQDAVYKNKVDLVDLLIDKAKRENYSKINKFINGEW